MIEPKMLLDRVPYYVPALDPTVEQTPRTLDDVIHDYTRDDEPRRIARLHGWADDDVPPANAIASHLWNSRQQAPSHLHRPCLDLDGETTPASLHVIAAMLAAACDVAVPVESMILVPSSTPGHHHLYVETIVPEVGYMVALMALATAGYIEHGYALVSIRRRATFLRLPGVLKAGATPAAPDDEVPW